MVAPCGLMVMLNALRAAEVKLVILIEYIFIGFNECRQRITDRKNMKLAENIPQR